MVEGGEVRVGGWVGGWMEEAVCVDELLGGVGGGEGGGLGMSCCRGKSGWVGG